MAKVINWRGWTFEPCLARDAEAVYCRKCGLLNAGWPILHPFWKLGTTMWLHRRGIAASEPGHILRYVRCLWPARPATVGDDAQKPRTRLCVEPLGGRGCAPGCRCLDCLEAEYWADAAYETQRDELNECQRP